MQPYPLHSEGRRGPVKIPVKRIRPESSPNCLLPNHAAMLEKESAISPAVIKARGYRSITDELVLYPLGFSDNQRIAPGLLIPLNHVNQQIISEVPKVARYQYRPDKPRCGKDEKPVKYETPTGSKLCLDVS